jgi:hypothetical protein
MPITQTLNTLSSTTDLSIGGNITQGNITIGTGSTDLTVFGIVKVGTRDSVFQTGSSSDPVTVSQTAGSITTLLVAVNPNQIHLIHVNSPVCGNSSIVLLCIASATDSGALVYCSEVGTGSFEISIANIGFGIFSSVLEINYLIL